MADLTSLLQSLGIGNQSDNMTGIGQAPAFGPDNNGNLMDILNSLSGNQSSSDTLAYDPSTNFQDFTDAAPVDMSGGGAYQENLPSSGSSQVTIPVSQTSSAVQQSLGVPQPQGSQSILDILANRFNIGGAQDQGPSFGDYSQAIQSSAYGKPASAQAFADSGVANQIKLMSSIGKGSGLASAQMMGGATGGLVRQLMAEDPNLSFRQALQEVQTGNRSKTMLDNNGNLVSIPNSNQVISEQSGAKKLGSETVLNSDQLNADAYAAHTLISAVDTLEEATKNFQAGASASAKTQVSRLAGALGYPLSAEQQNSLDNKQVFAKVVNDLIGAAAKAEGGSSRLVSAFNAIRSSTPNADLEPGALQGIFGYMRQKAGYTIDNQAAWANELGKNSNAQFTPFQTQYVAKLNQNLKGRSNTNAQPQSSGKATFLGYE